MPPKGWKKDAQGNYPTTSYIKEQEKITIDDLLFPKATVAALAKEVTLDRNDGPNEEEQSKVTLSKDAVTALQRSATVFVNHLLMYTRELAHSQDRKSCNVDDVLAALDEVGLGGLKGVVRSKLDNYLQALELRKEEKASSKDTPENAQDGDVDVDNEDEDEGEGEGEDEQGVETEDDQTDNDGEEDTMPKKQKMENNAM
ncbi:LAFE_0H09164g1_1 [Lachancea fermentati]|uniref:DNA polymerase epsilon subunit D n=1 Tax=Lachancea fermentati TaxID=4955 RepID=A0A1G4MK30_LACFM|nr:LAFE_0H09164g1_1 [Lachancea fermentati]